VAEDQEVSERNGLEPQNPVKCRKVAAMHFSQGPHGNANADSEDVFVRAENQLPLEEAVAKPLCCNGF
jgi:hypothetical protein